MATVPGSENVQFTKEQKQIIADFLPEKNKDINVVEFDPRDPPSFDKDLYNYGMFTVNFGKSYEMGKNLAGLTLGETGNANITGNDLDNLVLANGGDNTVAGGKGNDLVFGLSGDDNLSGDGGRDSIFGGDGSDSIDGGNGDDLLRGETGNDTIKGGEGDDSLTGGDGKDKIEGGADDDTLFGTGGNDKLFGDGGNDTLFGGSQNDTLNGGSGKNELTGDGGKNTFDIDDTGKGTKQTITDFVEGKDTIDLKDFKTKFGDLKLSNDKDGVMVQVKGSKVKILIEGFDKNDVKKDWFDF